MQKKSILSSILFSFLFLSLSCLFFCLSGCSGNGAKPHRAPVVNLKSKANNHAQAVMIAPVRVVSHNGRDVRQPSHVQQLSKRQQTSYTSPNTPNKRTSNVQISQISNVQTPNVQISNGRVSNGPAKPSIPQTPSIPIKQVHWAWPHKGPILRSFQASNAKGIDIAGTNGGSVKASAKGTVVYSGSGLKGYGNLIIIKHDEDFLSAYAHNDQLMVKEGERVILGQEIAKIGKTDTDRVKLHFEIRYKGKPVDPIRFLPS